MERGLSEHLESLRVKIAAFNFPKDSGIAVALEECLIVLVHVSVTEAGRGPCPPEAPASLPPLGGQMGARGLEPALCLGLSARLQNQDLLLDGDGETVMPLQEAGLK